MSARTEIAEASRKFGKYIGNKIAEGVEAFRGAEKEAPVVKREGNAAARTTERAAQDARSVADNTAPATAPRAAPPATPARPATPAARTTADLERRGLVGDTPEGGVFPTPARSTAEIREAQRRVQEAAQRESQAAARQQYDVTSHTAPQEQPVPLQQAAQKALKTPEESIQELGENGAIGIRTYGFLIKSMSDFKNLIPKIAKGPAGVTQKELEEVGDFYQKFRVEALKDGVKPEHIRDTFLQINEDFLPPGFPENLNDILHRADDIVPELKKLKADFPHQQAPSLESKIAPVTGDAGKDVRTTAIELRNRRAEGNSVMTINVLNKLANIAETDGYKALTLAKGNLSPRSALAALRNGFRVEDNSLDNAMDYMSRYHGAAQGGEGAFGKIGSALKWPFRASSKTADYNLPAAFGTIRPGPPVAIIALAAATSPITSSWYEGAYHPENLGRTSGFLYNLFDSVPGTTVGDSGLPKEATNQTESVFTNSNLTPGYFEDQVKKITGIDLTAERTEGAEGYEPNIEKRTKLLQVAETLLNPSTRNGTNGAVVDGLLYHIAQQSHMSTASADIFSAKDGKGGLLDGIRNSMGDSISSAMDHDKALTTRVLSDAIGLQVDKDNPLDQQRAAELLIKPEGKTSNSILLRAATKYIAKQVQVSKEKLDNPSAQDVIDQVKLNINAGLDRAVATSIATSADTMSTLYSPGSDSMPPGSDYQGLPLTAIFDKLAQNPHIAPKISDIATAFQNSAGPDGAFSNQKEKDAFKAKFEGPNAPLAAITGQDRQQVYKEFGL